MFYSSADFGELGTKFQPGCREPRHVRVYGSTRGRCPLCRRKSTPAARARPNIIRPCLGPGRELNHVRYAAGLAPIPIAGPRPGRIELAVDQGAPVSRCVGQEHPELTVADLLSSTGFLALCTGTERLPFSTNPVSSTTNRAGPVRIRAGHRAPRRHSSSQYAAAAAFHPATPRPHARPASSRSCARDSQAAHTRTSRPAAGTRYQLHQRIQRRDPLNTINHALIITVGQTPTPHDTPMCNCSASRAECPCCLSGHMAKKCSAPNFV
jgi:hypothetical protein